MKAEERARLKALIDERRRVLADAPADGRAHGTEVEYVNHGCRCVDCRRAANAARNRRRKTPNVSVHGNSGYSSGCRCDLCRKGHAAYNREYFAKKRAAA